MYAFTVLADVYVTLPAEEMAQFCVEISDG